ncbi:FMN-binding protein [Parasutterella excrementihominis]|uniref:FMN-binding protein n=1 Tax=Parasutterella excrementihominis TaxID=487175 RepID=UPI0024308A57|nr:FMN-binding protein [Parasutterella excrementihominis]
MRIVKLSAAILAALFLSATATAATITQEGSGIGKDGEIKVKVVFEDGKIKNVDILKQQENSVLSQKVFTDLKDEIVKTDSTELDVIAGAIYSSLGRIASQQAAQVAQAAK